MANQTTKIRPHRGPQEQAFASSADILIYGGSAGAGKSFYIVTEPTRYVKNPKFNGVIFRRTYPQLKGQGGIWQEAQGIYPGLGARMREGQELDARFPSGAQIEFSHLQHEKTKYEYQGHQICFLGFDELTHFSESQFFYLLSRNRSTCGVRPYVRATCNPDAGSWVAEFISWWIDQDSGYAIPERSGVLRYFIRGVGTDGKDSITWADSREELLEQFPDYGPDDILSVTFIPGKLDDNPTLVKKDPGYRGRLKSLPRVERDRLLGGNWKAAEGSQIESSWIKRYKVEEEHIKFRYQELDFEVPLGSFRRIATIDTAGTSREKAAELRGDPASYSVCAIWDSLPRFVTLVDKKRFVLSELLFLRHVWRAQVDWSGLKSQIPDVLQDWAVQKAYVENAHYGKPLLHEIKCCQKELVPTKIPGMDDTSRGAKLERAIASGMLNRVENGKIFVPENDPDNPMQWRDAYLRELSVWTGLPKETADQIDVTSHACHVTKRASAGGWGGTVKQVGVRG